MNRNAPSSAPKGIWQYVANSAGWWIFVFAGFGLVTLFLGEQKIRSRMDRQYQKSIQGLEDHSINMNSMPIDRGEGTRLDSEGNTGYSLKGLRWILWVGVFCGLILLSLRIVNLRRWHSSATNSGD